MLAIYLDEANRVGASLSTGPPKIIEKWFWATSFNGWFAGANTTDLRQAGDIMRGLALGRSEISKISSSTGQSERSRNHLIADPREFVPPFWCRL